MYTSITVKNHRSHKETILELCPGVNIIKGITQAGKSAFYQAFAWLRLNRPLGLSKRNWAANKNDGPMFVEVVNDGITISLEKSEETNIYKVNDLEFKTFGANVPEEVTKALQLSDINFHGQGDKHFLIASGPAEVARAINDITGLEQLDPALQWVTNEITNRNNKIAGIEVQIKEREEELATYKNLDKHEEKIVKLEKMIGMYMRLEKEESDLLTAMEQVKEVEEEMDEIGDIDIDKCERLMKQLSDNLEEAKKLHQHWDEVKKTVDEITLAQVKLESKRRKLAGAKKEFKVLAEELSECPFCGAGLEVKNLLEE